MLCSTSHYTHRSPYTIGTRSCTLFCAYSEAPMSGCCTVKMYLAFLKTGVRLSATDVCHLHSSTWGGGGVGRGQVTGDRCSRNISYVGRHQFSCRVHQSLSTDPTSMIPLIYQRIRAAEDRGTLTKYIISGNIEGIYCQGNDFRQTLGHSLMYFLFGKPRCNTFKKQGTFSFIFNPL